LGRSYTYTFKIIIYTSHGRNRHRTTGFRFWASGIKAQILNSILNVVAKGEKGLQTDKAAGGQADLQ